MGVDELIMKDMKRIQLILYDIKQKVSEGQKNRKT